MADLMEHHGDACIFPGDPFDAISAVDRNITLAQPDHRTRRGRRPFCGPSEAKLARTNTASPGNTSTPPVCSAFLRSSPVIASVVGKPTVLRLWATSSNSPRVTIPHCHGINAAEREALAAHHFICGSPVVSHAFEDAVTNARGDHARSMTFPAP